MDSVEEYLDSLEPADRQALEHIRRLVRKTVTDTEESISYALPTFKYKKKPLLYYGAFKDHLSVFGTSAPTAAMKDRLADFKTGKGTIRFTAEKPLPDDLLIDLVLLRKAQIDS